MEPHFSRDVAKHTMAIGQGHPKHSIWQKFDDRAFYFNCVFPRHVRISGWSFVIRIVCSKWAEGVPSAVQTVQPSSSSRTEAVPKLTIGSIANVMPARSFGPLPRLP